jgi:hypothetical protein
MFYQLTNDFAGLEKAKVDMFGGRCEERTLMTGLVSGYQFAEEAMPPRFVPNPGA